MRVANIIIENFRSVERANISPERFSVFVGQNNHGKTNFFEAIEWFYNAKSSKPDEHFMREEERIISVTLFFEDVEASDIAKLKTPANQTKIGEMLNGNTSFSVTKTSINHKRSYAVEGEDRGNPSGLDTAINEFLPKLEYVNTKIRLDDVSRYKDKNPIGTMLSGVLATIIENSKEYKDFSAQFATLFDSEESEVRIELNKLSGQVESYLKKQFPDGTSIKFAVTPPNFTDLLKNFETTVDDGVETKAEDKGDGMQRAIMLAIIQAFADYRKAQVGGGSFLFLIDEAELHLHPSAQRALKRALLDISNTDQVFINTHSSVLVVDNDDKQKIFRVEKYDRITEVREIDDTEKLDVIFELLGGSPSDLLLPRNFIIVEGRSDYVFLTTIIKRFYKRRFRGFKILFAGGDLEVQEPTLLAVHRLFRPLAGSENPIYKDRAIILIDKPNTEQKTCYDRFCEGYPYLFTNNQVFELPYESIEEYYPGEHKKAKGEVLNEEKVSYARLVADVISQEQFEQEMSVVFSALEACSRKGFEGDESDAT